MVFHEIDSITEVLNGHKVIVYYIEGNQTIDKLCSDAKSKCDRALESVLDMLTKKNDDLLIVKVFKGSVQFKYFQELYKPVVTGAVTLFAVNNEGIPIVCEHVNQEIDILKVVKSLSSNCQLNEIPDYEVLKIIQSLGPTSNESSSSAVEPSAYKKALPEKPLQTQERTVINSTEVGTSSFASISNNGNNESRQPTSSELQIRLPNGNRDKKKFDKDAMLQEVWNFISTKYNLKDFDLKTYNHQIFSEAEYQKSLQELDLYPNGVIIVLDKNVVPLNNNGGIGLLVQYGFQLLMTKTTSLFHYIHGMLLMFWNSLSFSNNGRDGAQNRIRPSQGSSDDQSSSQRQSKKSASKTFGNIHTLRRSDDSDDENNRYNGNSTQQK